MDEVVAIKVIDSSSRPHFFLTWGRAFGAIDPAPLLSAILGVLAQFGIESVRSIQVCDTLQRAVRQPYFFEASSRSVARRFRMAATTHGGRPDAADGSMRDRTSITSVGLVQGSSPKRWFRSIRRTAARFRMLEVHRVPGLLPALVLGEGRELIIR